jgi:4-hydroxy-tetrahydrodipicolinate synthase
LSAIFGPIITAMVTPFTGEGAVDYETAAKLSRYLVENGSTALVVAGTTGEGPALSNTEKMQLLKTVAEAVSGKAAVIAGTGGNSTTASVELTGQAAEYGADGVMLVTPYYNRPSQEGLYQHFKTVAAATRLPVMLYNVPARTGVNMTAETTLRLSEIDNIVGVKEASGNLEQVAAICKGAPGGFAVYCGDDALTLPMLSVGAQGVVSVASHLAGNRLAEMVVSYQKGQTERAREIHWELMPLFRGLFMATNPVPVKAALEMLGFNVGLPRLPLAPLNEAERNNLRALLSNYGLI